MSEYFELFRVHAHQVLLLWTALTAITAAIVGVILNLAIWFAVHFLFEETVALKSFPFDTDLPLLNSVQWLPLALTGLAAVGVLLLKISTIKILLLCAGGSMLVSLLF